MSYGNAFGLLGNFEITFHCGKQKTFRRSFRSFFSSSASIQSFGQISHIVWGPSLKFSQYKNVTTAWWWFIRSMMQKVVDLPWIWNLICDVYIRIPNWIEFYKTDSFAIQSIITPTFNQFQISLLWISDQGDQGSNISDLVSRMDTAPSCKAASFKHLVKKLNLSWIDKSTSKISWAKSTVFTCRNCVRINISVGFVGSGEAHLS